MRKAIIAISIIICAMIFYSGADSMTCHATDPIIEDGISPILIFCSQDNCMENLVYLIDNSEKVHCAFFDLDLEPVIEALESKYAKVVIDNNNRLGNNSRLNAVYDDSNQFTHNKFCIFDDSIVWTGSFNPTHNGNEHNDNNVLIFFSPALAKNYEDEFIELWNGDYGSGAKVENPHIMTGNITVENRFCPEDDCASNVIKELDNAEESIYFMTFSFTHDGIGEKIIKKHKRGIEVKGIFEKRQSSEYSEYDKMAANELDVKHDNNPYTMHHKTFIIDEKTVITGSFNPTMSGNTRNDENIVIIHDENIAREFLDEFNRLEG